MADIGISFEWTVRFGDVLTMGGAFAVAAGILYNRGRRDNELASAVKAALLEISEMKIELKAFSATIAKIAVQEMQIGLLMKWYDELRRGVGFVTHPARGGIEGEYKE